MWRISLFCVLSLARLVSMQDLSNCTAFSSDGIAASQYQYYRFYDFRRMKPGGITTEKGLRSKVVSDNSWKDDWYLRDYPRKSPGGYSIPINFIPESVFITNETNTLTDSTSCLTLSTARIDDETQDGGEIIFSEFNISYASLRVYSRVQGASGAVAGIFTYLNDTQESDIEIFTRSPSNYIQYSNQPASSGEPDWTPIPGATVNVSMPNQKVYTEWHMHRLDWTPGRSVFFVDNQQVNETTLHVPVASPPSGFYIDMWSANSTWSGSMEIGQNATLDILWIEMLFNTTQGFPTSGEKKVCKVKEGQVAAVQQSKAVSIRSDRWMLLVAVSLLNVILTWT